MNPGNVASAPASFTINAPAVVVPPPVVTGLNPGSAVAGGQPFTLTISGSGFVQSSSVHWNRGQLATSFSSATQLRAQVPAALIVNAGSASVTVVNPEGVTSGALNFVINPPAAAPPAISGLVPNTVAAGGTGLQITINGSGFQQGSTVLWNKTQLSTRFVGPAQLTAGVPANLIGSPGSAAVTVVNSSALPSGAATFTITQPPVTGPDPDAEAIKTVLAQYVEAFSKKDRKAVFALYPAMPKRERETWEEALKTPSFTVQYKLDLTAPPAIKGDDATVKARSEITTSLAGKKSNPVTKDVVISLHRAGGQWTISAFR
jgi:hypothetical protein